MNQYYLAVDIGASSGRHMLGWMENGKMKLEEIHRFPNGMHRENGHLCWDVDQLFTEILEGMKRCAASGRIPVSIGVDTWAVDYVLLDQHGHRLGPAIGYRDDRTNGMDEVLQQQISPAQLYARTGIQKQPFNTIYQLLAEQQQTPQRLQQVQTLLMIPDYFHYLLTGKMVQEYTNATTTQLVNPHTRSWDHALIEKLGLPSHLFRRLEMPGTVVGNLTPEIQKEVGFDCQVVLPPTHDTASAVVAVPYNQPHVLYISSGTWSLMGTERPEPDCREESRLANFTNEGGYGGTIRYLKNIMGLWMIQSVRKQWQQQGFDVSFDEMCQQASHTSIASIVDCNDPRFLAPEDMCKEVEDFCRESGQQVPDTRWELATVIYRSLAACYRDCAKEIENLTGRRYGRIHIVGGGAHAQYLNRLTAEFTRKPVCAGPTEATAIGNLAVQMIRDGQWRDLSQARSCIFDSFDIHEYLPQEGKSDDPKSI